MTCRESTASAVPAIFCSLYRRHTHAASFNLSTIYRLQLPPPLHRFPILLTFYVCLQIIAYMAYRVHGLYVRTCVCVWPDCCYCTPSLVPTRMRLSVRCEWITKGFHYWFGQTAIEDHPVHNKALLFFFSKRICCCRYRWLLWPVYPLLFLHFWKIHLNSKLHSNL